MSSEDRVAFESVDRSPSNRFVSIGTIGELDEETIRWGVLISRIICILLLCGIAVAVVLGETKDYKMFLICAALGPLLILFLVCSFLDLEMLRSTYVWRSISAFPRRPITNPMVRQSEVQVNTINNLQTPLNA